MLSYCHWLVSLLLVSSFVIYYFHSSLFFFFKQKTAYEMRISDWSSDVCSSDLDRDQRGGRGAVVDPPQDRLAVIADRQAVDLQRRLAIRRRESDRHRSHRQTHHRAHGVLTASLPGGR